MDYQVTAVGRIHNPRFWEVMDSEVISHLDHPHRLKLVHMNSYAKCEVCKTDVSRGLAFACERCYYTVCRNCAKLPSQMKHPFHPQHTIVLLEKKSPVGCKACGFITYGYLYDCEQCGFCLDLKCAALMPTQKDRKGLESPVIKHPHRLIVCENPKDSENFGCRLCFEPFGEGDLIYVCLECLALMDQNCAALPSEVNHPFHPEHRLSLLPNPPKDPSRCLACSGYVFIKDVVFYCSICDRVIDFHCSSLMPVLENSGLDKKAVPIQGASHSHPLIQCYSSMTKFRHKCYGCGLPFKDSIYVCLQCGILLHKSCADLPGKIVHHFHPQHPLILYENSVHHELYRSSKCGGCGFGHGDFVYVCQDCDFLLDIQCAMTDLLIIKSTVHQHSLALGNFDFNFKYCKCEICYRTIHKNGFRCVPCNFNIHDYCHPSFPKTIKHECHCDPLTFTTRKIKDCPDEYADEDRHPEVYCNACEHTRDLADPTYYCEECHFVAHIQCVFSEILPLLETTPEKLWKEVENIEPEPSKIAAADDDLETRGGDSSEEENEGNSQLVEELSQEILALKDKIDLTSARIDTKMDRRNELIRLLQHKLNQKTHLTGERQILPGYRQPVYIGYDESAKVTVSHIV